MGMCRDITAKLAVVKPDGLGVGKSRRAAE